MWAEPQYIDQAGPEKGMIVELWPHQGLYHAPLHRPQLSACLCALPSTCRHVTHRYHVLPRVDEKAGIDPSARPVFLLNCTCALSDVLAHHACCASGAAQVAAQVGPAHWHSA